MAKLSVVVVSTRPGRIGPVVANWVFARAQQHGKFDVELLDLAHINLPVFDEPHHPRLRKYEHEHTKRWSAHVDGSDAFVFVTPEYNFSAPPSLVNAIDYLFQEWAYKPAAFVSYGGVSGGLRAVQSAKLQLTTVKVVPLPEAVAIPLVSNHIEPDGTFRTTEALDKSANGMLDELLRWTGALKALRG